MYTTTRETVVCLCLPGDDAVAAAVVVVVAAAAVGGIRHEQGSDDELRSDDGSDGDCCGGSGGGGSGRCRPEQEGRLRRKLVRRQRWDPHPTRRSRYLATSDGMDPQPKTKKVFK